MSDRGIKVILVVLPVILLGMFIFDRVGDGVGDREGRPYGRPHHRPIIENDSAQRHGDTEEHRELKIDSGQLENPVCGRECLVNKLAEVYSNEIGVRELTGNNDGERVEEYLASCKLGKGYAWCAAFVNWCHVQVGIKGANSAWSPAWFPDSKVIYTNGGGNNLSPSKSDVFGIYYKEKKRIAHVGFIYEWTDGSDYCITVEGNTNDNGSREGDGVYRKRRLKNQIFKISRWIV
jgi:hypothetical protein